METIRAEKTTELLNGGAFLFKKSEPKQCFSPDDYTEEQHMLRAAIKDFINQEVEPLKDILDTVEGTKVAPELLEKLGALGFMAIALPETLGGMSGDIRTDLLASEILSDSFSFSQTVAIQKGLGINPMLFYGSEQQKAKYLKDIISGKLKCAYCLTEPSAGSDAASGKTRAVISEDGKHYLLTGQKVWITNAGFADIFTVFCKIENDKSLSCLIVEKAWGVELGAEEKKLGIKGSSTRQVFFDNVKVPVENLLGERNKGFQIAMNALNIGRLMIGIAGSAISKRALKIGVQYATQRIQFGQPIASFGAIQEKIAKITMRIFGLESAWNRLGGDMDRLSHSFVTQGIPLLKAKQLVAQDFAAECAIIKIYGSEVEQFAVDESLQMHGGMGFSGESEISIHYRNIRGNRIYEGTNEINRLVVPSTIIKHAANERYPLITASNDLLNELQTYKSEKNTTEDSFDLMATTFLVNCKKVAIVLLGQSVQKYQKSIRQQQQILSRLSDILSQIYILESTLLRVFKGKENLSEVRLAIAWCLMYESMDCINTAAKEVIYSIPDFNEPNILLKAINKYLDLPPGNIIQMRRNIAAHVVQQGDYKT